MNKKKLIGTILIIAGFVIIGAAGAQRLWADYKQKSMLETFQTTLQAADTERASAAEDAALSDMDENALGVIEIPKIELTAAIGKDVSTETLKYSVGHFKGTALPGEKGNCSIAGHRSYTYSEFFNRLDELAIGDEITIKTPEGTFKYVVYDKFVVEPSRVEVLDATEDATLTLVTCTPVRIATHRLIVKAMLQ